MDVWPKTYLNVFPNLKPNSNNNPNLEAQKYFMENKAMSFFGKVASYRVQLTGVEREIRDSRRERFANLLEQNNFQNKKLV